MKIFYKNGPKIWLKSHKKILQTSLRRVAYNIFFISERLLTVKVGSKGRFSSFV